LSEPDAALLADQLIAAEQEERRRLALELHDGPVQTLSGIALMLDAARSSLTSGDVEGASELLASIAQRQRDAIRSLRDLSSELEPIILRDQGFSPAVHALADQLGMANRIRIDLDIEEGELLAERAKVVLYQIIRDSLHQALRRGPLTRVSVSMAALDDGAVETVIVDDGAGERRRRVWEAIEERAKALQASVSVASGEDGGTTVRVVVPSYTAR
jgi:two-component system sensor histidine kinase DegS